MFASSRSGASCFFATLTFNQEHLSLVLPRINFAARFQDSRQPTLPPFLPCTSRLLWQVRQRGIDMNIALIFGNEMLSEDNFRRFLLYMAALTDSQGERLYTIQVRSKMNRPRFSVIHFLSEQPSLACASLPSLHFEADFPPSPPSRCSTLQVI